MSVGVPMNFDNTTITGERYTLLVVAFITDIIGIVSTLLCLATIGTASSQCPACVAFRLYKTTKDRIILANVFTSFCFLAFGMIIEHIRLIFGNSETCPMLEPNGTCEELWQPPWIKFLTYTFWWGILLTETLLLLVSVYILVSATRSTGLRPIGLSWSTELACYVSVVVLSVTVGTIATITYSAECGSGGVKALCDAGIRDLAWSWIGTLSVPFSAQMYMFVLMFTSNRRIAAFAKRGIDVKSRRSIVVGGDNEADALEYTRVSTMTRVINATVKPLMWYPIVFMIIAIFYVIWVVAEHTAAQTSSWAERVGPAVSLVFSIKGVSVSLLFYCSPDRKKQKRTLLQQIKHRRQHGDGEGYSAAAMMAEYDDDEIDADESGRFGDLDDNEYLVQAVKASDSPPLPAGPWSPGALGESAPYLSFDGS